MNIENFISDAVRRSVETLYGPLDGEQLQIQKTRREFEGDYTLVTFPLLRRSRKSPEATATEIGEYMTANVPEVKSFNVIKGFLNLTLDCAFWAARFAEIAADANFGQAPDTGRTVMIEYSSPNTNKPLHLGHIRNNLLGYSVAQILRANGHNVIKANLVNDRGIHICKSMLAWKLYGNGETPASSGMKGDHLVGKYYVEFDKHYKAQIKELTAQGQTEEEAKKNAPVMLEAQEMLRKWEARDPEVYSLWETMNGWVYEGFDVTYKALGVDFDKVYYESQTYLLGKSLVEEGLRKGVFYRRRRQFGVDRPHGRRTGRETAAARRRHVGLHDAGPRHGLPPLRGQQARRHDLCRGQRAELPLPGAEADPQETGLCRLERPYHAPLLRHGGASRGQDEVARGHGGRCRRPDRRHGLHGPRDVGRAGQARRLLRKRRPMPFRRWSGWARSSISS